MRKIYLALFVAGLFVATFSNAQKLQDIPKKKPVAISKNVTGTGNPAVPAKQFSNSSSEKCGFKLMMDRAKAKGFNEALYEQKMAELIALKVSTGKPTVIYTVPVIFHVIYSGTTEPIPGVGANVTRALVDAQIAQLNIDFANMAGSVYGVAQDMGIRFVPARVDPVGNLLCEPGIERIDWETKAGWTDPTTLADEVEVEDEYDNTVKPQSIWDPYRYVNVWLGDFSASGLLGYATFPANSTLAGLSNSETDLTAGVVILSGSVGSVTSPGSTSPYDLGRTITHELGHFFGLRHIWGDGTCATDYCTDTPPQDDATAGCPATGTLNNCAPSGPKMFENYMDYTDDACMNTFTLNQSQRCQTVMTNSPRRISLATSNAGVSPFPNRISFKSGVTAVVETGTTGAVCPRYRDVLVTVSVDGAATGNATLSLTPSGTATNTADYIIVNNTATYTNGDNSDKVFTIRIYDDGTIESSELITLGLSITGTGVQTTASCPAANTYNITITDDDYAIDVNNTTPTTTLITQNFGTTTGSNQVPAGWTTSNSGVTTNKWVGNNAGAATYGFTGNTLHISNGAAAAVTNGTAAMTYTLTATTDARVTTPTVIPTGLKNVTLSFNYVSNGEIDLGVIYDLGVVYFSIDGGTNYNILTDALGDFYLFQGVTTKTAINIPLPASIASAPNLKFLFRWLSDNSGGSQPPFAIDDVVLTGQSATVEDQLNNTGSSFLPAGAASSYIYSTDGQIIARINNLSAQVGCVDAVVSGAGTGQTNVTTQTGLYQRTNKVVRLTPTAANTTATYQVTLYYTTAELAAWGANVATLKLLKVKDGVSLASTLNNSNAAVFATTVDDQRGTKGYASFTANVTGGFSQFMLASPPITIPVTLVSFEARPNGKNILLNWSTVTEQNNKGFAIERSTNGVNFEKIGWVTGVGNSSQMNRYSYIDNFVQPNVLYYYRLRQTDFDNVEKLSEIRQAKIKGSDISISLSPNPARDQLKIFISGTSGVSDMQLVNAEGQVVRNWKKVNATAAPAALDIRGLASGTYMLHIVMPQSTTVEKLIIQ